MPAQVINFLRGEVNVLEKIERLLETGCDQIIAMRRKMADEQFERGTSLKAGLQIARSHCQLVQIG